MISYMVKGFREFAKKLSKLKKRKKRVISSYSCFRFILFLSLIQTVMAEAIQRGGLFSALSWVFADLPVFMLNYLLTLLLCLFFISIIGRLLPAVICSSVFLILLASVSLVKKQFLGDPLFPWDFSRLDQAWDLLPEYATEFIIVAILFGLFVLGLLVVGRMLIPRYKANWITRSTLFLFIIVVVPVLVFYRHTPLDAVLKKGDIEHIYWMQSENTLRNGFLLGFMMNIENIMIFQPESYNATNIERIVTDNLPDKAVLAKGTNTEHAVKPNIIFVLNEAFWDPTLLTEIEYSEDPIPFFRELRKNQVSGTMISPVFGGSTANVEFEILTGLSTKFLPQGAIAYQQYIERPLPAIPDLFRANNYVTAAIHPYHDWFYKRNEVFPLLGFDNFYSLKDFQDAEKSGEYISDREVSKMIISQIRETKEPAFIFALTMQNHGPYPEKRYSSNAIEVTGPLTPQSKEILETYTHGLKEADTALKELIKGLQKLDEPSAVIFMGDHLPFLGKEYLVYKQTGYITGNENQWSAADTIKMRSVPFIIWSNYGKEFKDQTLSSQYIGHFLLDLAGIEDSFLSNFTREMSEKLPVYGKTVNIDNEGKGLKQLPDDVKKLEEDYWLLQYDILFGQQYYKDYS